jgi:hypothetical protein
VIYAVGGANELLVAAIAAAFVYVWRRGPARSLVNVAEKSIAVLPFENSSAEKQNE